MVPVSSWAAARVRVEELQAEADRILSELAAAEVVLERRAIARVEPAEALAAPGDAADAAVQEADGRGDHRLLEAIPQLGFRFAKLPDALKREIFDGFQLRVRYDGRDRGVQLQVTILAAVAPDLAQIGERAAMAVWAVDQPIRERPRQDSNLRPSA